MHLQANAYNAPLFKNKQTCYMLPVHPFGIKFLWCFNLHLRYLVLELKRKYVEHGDKVAKISLQILHIDQW
jgi:hypothetical protein